MKNILLYVFSFVSFTLNAQVNPREIPKPLGTSKDLLMIQGRTSFGGYTYSYMGDTADVNRPTRDRAKMTYKVDKKDYIFDSLNNRWFRDTTAGGAAYDSAFNSHRPSTRPTPGLEGVALNKDDIKATLEELLYPTQKPLVTLTGGLALEFMVAGGNLSYNVAWSIARQAKTNPIASASIAGTPYTSFNNAAPPPYSENALRTASVPRNTNTTFFNIATTNDGKSDTATTTFTFTYRRYFLWLSDTTGLSSGALDAAIIASPGELSGSRTKTWTTTNPSGTQYYVYAYIASAGALTSFKMNGFESLLALNTFTRTLTTTAGFTGAYRYYCTKNGQTLPSINEAQ